MAYAFIVRYRTEGGLHIPKIIVSEEQWLEAGMDKFAQSGVQGLVIEKMATELKCSKSSFYWYFKNRNEYLRRLVERWVELSTEVIIREGTADMSQEEGLEHLLKQMFSVTRKGDFLFYLRKLGRKKPDYEVALSAIEETRITYARKLFERLGMDKDTAQQKASILYHYYLGWYQRHKDETVSEKELNLHIAILRKQLIGL